MNYQLLIVYSWTVVASLGVIITILALCDALGDLIFLYDHQLNGRRRIQAKGNIRDEVIRLYIHVNFLAVGLMALYQQYHRPHLPPQFHHHQPHITLFTYVFTYCLVSSEVALVAKSIFDRYTRRQLIEYGVLHDDEHAAVREAAQALNDNTDAVRENTEAHRNE